MKRAALALILVVVVSGCVQGIQGFRFGSAQKEVEAPNDVLVIKNEKVVPTPPIPADSSFELSFLVQNTGNAEQGKEARETKVVGFDWGRCNPQNQDLLTTNEAGSRILEGIPDQPVTIFPGGGSQLVEWEFRAPTNEKLGQVQGECAIRYRVQYNFRARTVTDLAVVSEERLRQANRAGETVTVTPVTSKSKGPLKIDIGIGSDQPVREGTTVPLQIRVNDQGQGLMRQIPTGELGLTFPEEFVISCDENAWNVPAGNRRVNANNVAFIEKQTPPLRCDVTVPEVTDIKTFSIRAELPYTYRLFGETTVTIEPTVTGVTSERTSAS